MCVCVRVQKIESTKHRLETSKKYVDTLERVSHIVKKNLISIKKVQEIKEDVEYYVENNDQSDFPSNMDNLDIFEDLELEKYDSSSAGTHTIFSFFLCLSLSLSLC